MNSQTLGRCNLFVSEIKIKVKTLLAPKRREDPGTLRLIGVIDF